jgi:hypothetical protein
MTQADWRLAADPEDLREYDAFGPWIDPVTAPDQMPRPFRPWYDEFRDADFLLKVPRDVERAKVRPGDDLYRAVLAVDTHRLCLLELQAHGVHRTEAALREVVATRVSTSMLLGDLTFLMRDGSQLSLAFNTTAARTVEAVAAHVRRRAAEAAGTEMAGTDSVGTDAAGAEAGWQAAGSRTPDERPPAGAAVPVPDFYFAGRLSALRGELGEVVPVHSNGSMLLCATRELLILNRGDACRPLFLPTDAKALLRVPYRVLTAARIDLPKGRSSFQRLVLVAGEQAIQQECLQRPDSLLAELARRGVAVHR